MSTLQLSDSVTLVVCERAEDRFEVEATYEPRGARPPKHWHPHHDERFEVLAGTLRIGFPDGEHDFGDGDTVDIPRGTVHHMWNPGDTPTRVRWLSTPPGRVEEFFTAMDRVNRGGKAGLVGQAGVFRAHRDVVVTASPIARAAISLLGRLAG
jgi:quercetin dioxygenase-like cupin family protein